MTSDGVSYGVADCISLSDGAVIYFGAKKGATAGKATGS
jgi:hypothetical protein